MPSGPPEFGLYYKTRDQFVSGTPYHTHGENAPLFMASTDLTARYEESRQQARLRQHVHTTEEIYLKLPNVRLHNPFFCEQEVAQHLPKRLSSPHSWPQTFRVDLLLSQPAWLKVPVLSRQACVTIQPWPPPLPTNHRDPGFSSAVKPVVYSPLSEGFKGGGR